MPADDDYKIVQEFLWKMDAGDFGDKLAQELGRLTIEQRSLLAQFLTEREMGSHAIN